MKYIVIQSHVGCGTVWSKDGDADEIDKLYSKYLIPSVKRYCKKYKYKHFLETEPMDILDILSEKEKLDGAYLYHKFLSVLKYVNHEFDYVLFLDADFFITHDAIPLPQTKMIKGVHWPDKDVVKHGRGYDPKSFKTVNGGWVLAKKEVAISLATYIKERMKAHIVNDEPMILWDEITIGEFFQRYKIVPEDVNEYYNFMCGEYKNDQYDKWSKKIDYNGITKPGFWHIAGYNKFHKLSYLLDRLNSFDLKK